MNGSGLHRRRGTMAGDPWALELTPEDAGWDWCSLRVLDLPPGGCHSFESGGFELLVLPLSGSCTVRCGTVGGGEVEARLEGRGGVFDGTTDFAFIPPGSHVRVESAGGGRFAIPGARAEAGRSQRFQRVPATQVGVELRGAGACSREVHNICLPSTFECKRLLVCEVVTPGGNWSSYPPHKHDEDRPGESVLEEIYYFEVADGPGGPGLAYQRVYGTAQRPIDVLAEVGTGDVVLVPHGWHGPSMAATGYDLYYLNVMGGPGERAWRVCDDPAHAWIRASWEGQHVDPRLPLASAAHDTASRPAGTEGVACEPSA